MSASRRIGVLVSGGGRSLANLADKIRAGELEAEIALVLSNSPQAFALERARQLGVPHTVVDHRAFSGAPEFSAAVFHELDARSVDLAVLAGWLRLLVVPERWAGRVINIHPALLPKFGGKGYFGERVHRAVIESGDEVSGCTVHYVTNEYDAGPVLLQRRTLVHRGDTPDSLAARVFEEEKIALPEAIGIHFGRREAPTTAR